MAKLTLQEQLLKAGLVTEKSGEGQTAKNRAFRRVKLGLR